VGPPEFILAQALAFALAFRNMNAMNTNFNKAGLQNRIEEFGNLFELAAGLQRRAVGLVLPGSLLQAPAAQSLTPRLGQFDDV